MWFHEKRIFVTATDTGVGKTFVSTKILEMYLHQGLNPCYFKPVATGAISVGGKLVSEDVLTVQKKIALRESPEFMNPVCYEIPAAPLVAAQISGKPLPLALIQEAYQRLHEKYDCFVVEGIGGVLVPLTETIMVLDLIKAWGLPTLVVARATLGTINHTALTIQALRDFGVKILGIVISCSTQENPVERHSFPVIEKITQVPILKIFPHEKACM
jgi:dethiobiotin synthetase